MLYGFHVEIPLAIFLASPQFSGQCSLFLPSSVSKVSTKEQIASKGHCRDINSHNCRGKFPEGMMAERSWQDKRDSKGLRELIESVRGS